MEEKEKKMHVLEAAEEDLKKAWDLLEEMSVRGYQARYRITVAQERILTAFERIKLLKRGLAEEKEPCEEEDCCGIAAENNT